MAEEEPVDLHVGLKYRSRNFPCTNPCVFGSCVVEDLESNSSGIGKVLLSTFFNSPSIRFVDSDAVYSNLWLPPNVNFDLDQTNFLVGENYSKAEARLVNPLLYGKRDIFLISGEGPIAKVYSDEDGLCGFEEGYPLELFIKFYKDLLKSNSSLRGDGSFVRDFFKVRKLEKKVRKRQREDPSCQDTEDLTAFRKGLTLKLLRGMND